MRRACTNPDVCEAGRSICVMSPVTIILVFIPIRVRNILICCAVVFCASSRITTASFSVRPRIKANGAIWIMFNSMYSFNLAAGIISCRASYKGCRYGSILSFMSPGRKPSFSPASTAGRLRMIFLISLFFNARTARAIAVYVFPEPAGPMANTISFLANPSTSFNWFSLRGMIGFPVTLNTITFPVCSACGAFPFIMSMITSSFSELYSAQYFSSLVIFSSKAHISSSSPSTLMTLPRATMRSFGYKALINCMLALFTP